MRKRNRTLFLALIVTFSLGTANARMYRWVDENGVTVYSQSPPPSGDAVTLEKQRGPSVEETAAARERLQQQVEQSFDAREARTQAAEEEAKQEEEERVRTENCEAARKNLETLRDLGRRMVKTPEGRYVRMEEDMVEVKKKQAQKQVEEYCK